MTDQLKEFLNGKTEYALSLFRFFIDELNTFGAFEVKATKTMIALQSTVKFAYVTQLGKNFIHIVLPFNQPFYNQLCFSKIANVPGTNQFNHHLRIYYSEDFNDEVMCFLKLAYEGNHHA